MRTITEQDIATELEVFPPATHTGETFLRFMSDDEFTAYIMGNELVNEHDHSRDCETNSVGFCFLRMGDRWTEWVPSTEPERVECALSFLSGVVSDDVALVVRNESAAISEGAGLYADPDSCEWDAFIGVNEFCTSSYDRTTMVPVRAYLHPSDKNPKVIEF